MKKLHTLRQFLSTSLRKGQNEDCNKYVSEDDNNFLILEQFYDIDTFESW